MNKDKAIEAALPKVQEIATQIYQQAQNQGGVEWDELVAVGNLALVEAAQRWDPEQGDLEKFAAKRIRGAIRRHIGTETRTIRLTEQTHSDIYKLRRAENELTQKLQRTPTRQEIAEHAYIPPEEAEDLMYWHNMRQDAHYQNEEGEWCDGLQEIPNPDTEQNQTEHTEQQQALIGAAMRRVDKLPPFQKAILHDHIGAADRPPKTNRQIAQERGLTPDDIRKTLKHIQASLRHPAYSA